MVSEGYLIAECNRCGSILRLAIKGVRNEVSYCPVCMEGELQCRAVQTDISLAPKSVIKMPVLNPYIERFLKLSSN